MIQADQIRQTAIEKYIQPARRAGQIDVVIRAGDLHHKMKLADAMPAVCSALRARKFEQLAGVRLLDVIGPRNGANVYFRFALDGRTDAPPTSIQMSQGTSTTPEPTSRRIDTKAEDAGNSAVGASPPIVARQEVPPSVGVFGPCREPDGPEEQHYTIASGDTGHSYDTIFGRYLPGARSLVVEDPYIRSSHQIANFVRFCETVVKATTIRTITLITSSDPLTDIASREKKLDELKQSLIKYDIELVVYLKDGIHDREVQLDNGWTIKIGRGLDFYEKPDGWSAVGATNLSLRRCRETKVDVYRTQLAKR